MTTKTIVTCAITGSDSKSVSSGVVPITPKEIAESALAAWRAGAAIVHIHVRHPETGRPSVELDHYREVVERIRSITDELLINLTTGPGALFKRGNKANTLDPTSLLLPAADRVRHVLELSPDICTLDMGSLNFWDGALVNTESDIREMASFLYGSNTKLELEIFDSGQLSIARRLLSEGAFNDKPIFQFVMGGANTAPADPGLLNAMASLLPPDVVWTAFGVGRHSFPMVAQSYFLNGHVRVGLEDNLYISKGVKATSNAVLVEKAVEILRLFGGEPATSEEARSIIGV